MIDPSMSSVHVETEFVEQSKKEDSSNWVEKPLHELRKLFVTPESKKFLEQNIVAKQLGRNHPQDPEGTNPEMKLYWVFEDSRESTSNSSKIGNRTSASAQVPMNKAARGALADSLTTRAAEFQGKGHAPPPPPPPANRNDQGKGNLKGKSKKDGKGKDKGKEKTPKAGSKSFLSKKFLLMF